MSNRIQPNPAAWVVLVLASCLFNSACSPTLFDGDYLTHPISPDRLRQVQTLEFKTAPDQAGDYDPQKATSPPDPPVPPAPPEELTLTLAQARAAALQYNLDLQVQLINPTIARQSITEQEAQYEALFFSNLSLTKTDTPTNTTLSGTQTEQRNADVGLRIPLRTGGLITLDLPVSRFETDNIFSTLNPSHTADASVSISQPLLRGGGLRANTHAIRLARYQSLATEARTKLELIRILTDVDRAYWRLVATRSAQQVRKQEYDLANKQLERARRQVDAGVSAQIEIIRAQVGVVERFEAIIITDNNLREREREFKRILNQPGVGVDSPTVITPATTPMPVKFELDMQHLGDTAVTNRMELLELELRLAQQASEIDFARNQTLPLVNLTYRYNVNGLGSTERGAFDMLSDRNFEDHRVALSVEAPLGNEAAKSRLRRAIATRLQTLTSRQQRQIMIRQEVLNAVDQLQSTWQRILANRQRRQLAERSLEAEIRQFEQGASTSTDVLDAQTSLAQAQLAQIVAVTEYQIAQVDLAFATGTLLGAAQVRWEPIEPDYNKP